MEHAAGHSKAQEVAFNLLIIKDLLSLPSSSAGDPSRGWH